MVTDSLHTRSDFLRLHLLPECRIEVVQAGPGVENAEHSRGFGLDLRPYVLYVGGHALHKNVRRLIAAFARVSPEARLRLVLAGWSDPLTLAHTEKAIRHHGVGDRVVVLPSGLSDEQVSDLYRNCSVFVYPSLYEGFGLPVLEAMAHGAPVACSDCSSLPEVGGDAVLYFNPLSIDDIAAKMEAVVGDAQLALRLGIRGRTRAREFSWERTARGIYAAASAAVDQRLAGKRHQVPVVLRQ